jgi:hypothetical protein
VVLISREEKEGRYYDAGSDCKSTESESPHLIAELQECGDKLDEREQQTRLCTNNVIIYGKSKFVNAERKERRRRAYLVPNSC